MMNEIEQIAPIVGRNLARGVHRFRSSGSE
jgi:hypothetical protein